MATATITDFVTTTVNSTVATSSSTARVTPQGGLFEGLDPSVYDPKNPLVLFVIQASIVIILTRIIHVPLAKVRQPRVIAEVLTGIILGPSIMGRIPGFTDHIFPTASMPAFLLAANLGLVFFLFLVGLEVDLRYLASNWRVALGVGAAGMAVPFGLGCAIAYGLFHQFRTDSGEAPISFGIYMLFIGVAMAITAFPVLCRILTSLKLLSTPVGVIVLSAGVANDVVGWILLALCVALVNSGAGLTALWILLVAVGYALFLVFIVRPCFMYMLRKTGSLANGPTQTVVAVTVLLVLASAFFTGVIGIHPIFGAFMIGLMAPHEGGFAIKLTEKLEDLIGVLFLPLYFVSSGLSTNLGLLNNGITWGYVVGICACAFFGKVAGGTLASRLTGLVWRESLTIGCLMSCKGLVELIVLNIGLQAKILSQRTFTMFVVMALLTTVATTPLTMSLYPPWYQRKLELWKQGKIDWDGNAIRREEGSDESGEPGLLGGKDVAKRILVYLRLDGLPSLFTMISMIAHNHEELCTKPGVPPTDMSQAKDLGVVKNTDALASLATLRRPLQIHGLRLMELTERGSSVMRVSEMEEFAGRDPIIKAFGTFGQSRNLAVDGQIAVVPDHSFSGTLLSRAQDLRSDLILIPWSETGSMSEYPNIFDAKPGDPLANRAFAMLAAETFDRAHETCHVGVFIEKTILCASSDPTSSFDDPTQERPVRQLSRTLTGVSMAEQMNSIVHFKFAESGRFRLVVLYHGTQDDLFAVRFALQLAKNDMVDLQILDARSSNPHDEEDEDEDDIDAIKRTGKSTEAANVQANADYEFETLRASIPESRAAERISVVDLSSVPKLEAVMSAISERGSAETVVVLGRGSKASHEHQSTTYSSSSSGPGGSSSWNQRDESRALGPLATAVVRSVREQQLQVGLLVVQARREGTRAEAPPHGTLSPLIEAKDVHQVTMK